MLEALGVLAAVAIVCAIIMLFVGMARALARARRASRFGGYERIAENRRSAQRLVGAVPKMPGLLGLAAFFCIIGGIVHGISHVLSFGNGLKVYGCGGYVLLVCAFGGFAFAGVWFCVALRHRWTLLALQAGACGAAVLFVVFGVWAQMNRAMRLAGGKELTMRDALEIGLFVVFVGLLLTAWLFYLRQDAVRRWFGVPELAKGSGSPTGDGRCRG